MIPVLNDSPIEENDLLPPPKPVPAPRLSEDEAECQAHDLKAIADATRLRIISLLMAYGGEVCVNDIVACFRLDQATISHHLRILRDAGLIGARKHAMWSYYFVKHERLRLVLQTLTNLIQGEQTSII